MPQLQLIIILALVVYRIVRFLIADSLIDEQRKWFQAKVLGKKPKGWRDKLFDLTECPYCMSVWVAAATVAVTDQFVSIPLPVLAWLAVCGATMIVWRFVETE